MASTIMTENKNDKEMLLVGTLQYWRNLDVSTVFYAWLKYTARKKFLRQTQDSLLERKQEYLLHTMFLKWNRELYGRNASSDLSVCCLFTRFTWFESKSNSKSTGLMLLYIIHNTNQKVPALRCDLHSKVSQRLE